MSRAQDGRIQAYIIFGLAHRDSLNGRFESLGIPTERLFINTSNELLSELRNIAEQAMLTIEERKKMIERYYLGKVAVAQQVHLAE